LRKAVCPLQERHFTPQVEHSVPCEDAGAITITISSWGMMEGRLDASDEDRCLQNVNLEIMVKAKQ